MNEGVQDIWGTPKRCNFDNNVECFEEGCFTECRHHPLTKAALEKPKKHEKLKTLISYHEVDRVIKSIPKLLLYIIYGFSMFLGLIAIFSAAMENVFPIFLIGLLMTILPPFIHFRESIIAIFSFCRGEMVEPFFLWIVWIRKQGFLALLNREYATQFGAVIFTFFALYQFRILQMLPYLIAAVAGIIGLVTGSWEPWEELVGMLMCIPYLLMLLFLAAIPGFFVGFLTGSEGKGKNSVGLGSFLAVWVSFVFWVPEIFSWGWSGVWFNLLVVFILIGMTIYSFTICLVGMGCGYLGEIIGIGVRREILKMKIWKLKERKEAVDWELEDRLKELKEQLSLGAITQEEYEQKKKKLLEKYRAR